MMDNSTRWVRVWTVRPIQRNEFAADFHPIAATWRANVPRIMLPVTSKDWAISARSTAASNCNYGAMHAG